MDSFRELMCILVKLVLVQTEEERKGLGLWHLGFRFMIVLTLQISAEIKKPLRGGGWGGMKIVKA